MVCHPFGGPKAVEPTLLRAADSSTIWYIDALKEGCHGGAVFLHDLWVGVHVQPGLTEVSCSVLHEVTKREGSQQKRVTDLRSWKEKTGGGTGRVLDVFLLVSTRLGD